MPTSTRDRVLHLVKHGFVRLPWGSKSFRPDEATDDTYLIEDLGFDPETYIEFIDEFAFEFPIAEPCPAFPKDERVSAFAIAELKEWPDGWRA